MTPPNESLVATGKVYLVSGGIVHVPSPRKYVLVLPGTDTPILPEELTLMLSPTMTPPNESLVATGKVYLVSGGIVHVPSPRKYVLVLPGTDTPILPEELTLMLSPTMTPPNESLVATGKVYLVSGGIVHVPSPRK